MSERVAAPNGRIDAATLRYYAVLSDADPRSVSKVLEGKPVRVSLRRRIRAALEAAGVMVPKAEAAETPAVRELRVSIGELLAARQEASK